MNNLIHKCNKVRETLRKRKKVNVHLSFCTFECGVIYTAFLVRTIISYAAETMYNVVEKEYRTLEQIEESLIKDFCYKESLFSPSALRGGRSVSCSLSNIQDDAKPSAVYAAVALGLNIIQSLLDQKMCPTSCFHFSGLEE